MMQVTCRIHTLSFRDLKACWYSTFTFMKLFVSMAVTDLSSINILDVNAIGGLVNGQLEDKNRTYPSTYFQEVGDE